MGRVRESKKWSMNKTAVANFSKHTFQKQQTAPETGAACFEESLSEPPPQEGREFHRQKG